MDDCVFPPANSAMDVDYMEELLLGGCWLETTDGSDFLNQIPPTSAGYYDASLLWPMLEANGTSIASPSFRDVQEEGRRSDMLENSTVYDHEGGALVNNTSPSKSSVTIAGHSDQIGNLFADGSELNRMIWIAPSMNPSPAYSVMTRLMTALDYIKGSTKNKDVLIQIWVPIRRGGSNFLTTSEQPFSLLDPNCPKLIHYRKISEDFLFAADEVSKETLGLPGRVFVTKVPEWTPDVRFFRVEEYPRVGHAQQYDVRGTLALPVFEQGSRNCLGVVEVIMTTQKVNYRPELESVCKALEAVDLRSSDCWNVQHVKEHSSSYQAALPEILEVLKSACESHGLPLAQTWVPCIQQGKDGCRHSDENLIYCVSTVDSACFIADPQIRGFHEACSEHHLLKGQGVSGRAFLTNQPCFSEDIRTFSRTEYPLAHHARMFGICAAVAIRLRCVYTGTSDFVLEFFLPLSMRDPQQQEKMLSSLSVMLQQVCRSLRVVTELELEQESAVPVENMVVLPDDSPKRDKMETASKGENASLPLQEDCSATAFQQASTMSSVLTEDNSRELLKGKLPEQKQYRVESTTKVNSEPGGDCTLVGEGGSSNLGKSGEKRRTKAEKNITLEVLRQHFAGSLKDAAKSIGVCPTTLKRICRQHGIKRWPSRKIKKVGHSLQKLQVVIDSVEGASGAFQIGSFYPNFPDRGSPNRLGNSPLSTEKPSSDLLQASRDEPENGSFSPQTVASKSPPSSCSQSSTSSSQCYSSGNQQQTSVWNAEDHLAGASSSECVLKRVKSEAEVCASRQDIKEHISRSQSQKSFSEHHDIGDNRPPLPKHVVGGLAVQEGNAWRVKVTYGEEKIRFRLLKGRGFKNVVQEVVKRFNIGDMGGFQLKYLDDDLEWVLLTCDADLEECIDIYRSSQRQTIKLSLQVSHSHSRSSVGSNGQL